MSLHDRPANRKFHGVITEDRVQEQTERTGVYPFTFTSSAIIATAALLGYLVLPVLLSMAGVDVKVTMLALGPLCVSLALAATRYLIDSKRGVTRGFWVTFAVALSVLLTITYLLVFRGVAL